MNGGLSQAARVAVVVEREFRASQPLTAFACERGAAGVPQEQRSESDCFTPAVTDLLRKRHEQVAGHGHTPAADDATGPRRLCDKALNRLLMARDMLHGDPARLDPRQRAALRDRLITAAAIIIATTDTLDRIPVNGGSQ